MEPFSKEVALRQADFPCPHLSFLHRSLNLDVRFLPKGALPSINIIVASVCCSECFMYSWYVLASLMVLNKISSQTPSPLTPSPSRRLLAPHYATPRQTSSFSSGPTDERTVNDWNCEIKGRKCLRKRHSPVSKGNKGTNLQSRNRFMLQN